MKECLFYFDEELPYHISKNYLDLRFLTFQKKITDEKEKNSITVIRGINPAIKRLLLDCYFSPSLTEAYFNKDPNFLNRAGYVSKVFKSCFL